MLIDKGFLIWSFKKAEPTSIYFWGGLRLRSCNIYFLLQKSAMAATAKMMHWIDPVTTYKSEKIAFFTFAPLTLLYLYGSSSVMPLAANIKSTSIMHTIWHEFTPRWLLLSHCQTCEVIIRLHVSPLLSYFFVAFQHCIVIKCNSWLSNFCSLSGQLT